jgi:hypothetical protein
MEKEIGSRAQVICACPRTTVLQISPFHSLVFGINKLRSGGMCPILVQKAAIRQHLCNYCTTRISTACPADGRLSLALTIGVLRIWSLKASQTGHYKLSVPTPNVGASIRLHRNWKWSPLISGCIARVTQRSDLSARKSLCFRLCGVGKGTLGVELLSAFAARVRRKL